MASSAEELLVIARLKNELSRPLKTIRGEMAAVKHEIAATGTATKEQSAQMRTLQRELDATSKRSANLGKHLSDIGSRMTRNVTLPVLLGFAAMGKAAIDDEKSQAVLARTLKNTEHATSGQVKATEAWIRKTQFATGISDNELRPALGKLILSHRSTTQAQSDLNIAMDVSIARHMSLETVVQAFAKAANGQTQGLRRLGIQTTDAAGRALTYDQILAKLAQTTGGSMADAANTAEGRIKRLRERTREFGEDIGNRLLPMIDKAVRAFSGLFDWFGHLGAAGQDFFIIGTLALAAVGPILKIAGSYLTLAKAYREWQAARAGGAALGLASNVGIGAGAGAAGGIGIGGGITFAAAAATLAAYGYTYNKGRKQGQRVKSYAAGVLGPAGVAGAAVTPQQRLAAIHAGQAQLRTLADWQNGKNVQLPGIGSANEAYAAQDELRKRVKEQQSLYRATEGNVAHLTETMSMSRGEVERLAAAHGVDLSGSLQSVTRDMKAAAAAARTQNEVIADQEVAYQNLKTSMDNLQPGRERLLGRFLSEKSADFQYQDAVEALRKAKSPKERANLELQALSAGQSLLDARVQAGRYGPKGLNQVQYAAQLNGLVPGITAGGDPAGIAAIVRDYLGTSAVENPKAGQQAAEADVNTFRIVQNFYGFDPTAVGPAAKSGSVSGFDEAAHAKAHKKKTERKH